MRVAMTYDDDCAAELLGGTMSDYMWYVWSNGQNGHPSGSKEVGQLTANQFGLFDMHGNLWEWCEDYWHENYVGAPTNGSEWVSPLTSYRVLRGGYWGLDSAWVLPVGVAGQVQARTVTLQVHRFSCCVCRRPRSLFEYLAICGLAL